VNGLGRKTTYTYDPLGREASLTDPLGRTTTYGYDLAGNRTSLTDAKGRTTTYAYDAGNELTSVTYSDVTTPNVSFTYDADGRRASMTDGTGTTTYAYDALGRLSKDVQGGGAHVSYGYDLAGNLAKITYPNGKAVTRAYDAAGRLASVTDWLGHKTAFTYDRDSNLVAETYPNGVVASFIYDATGRLTHIMDAHGTKTLLDLAYKRDKLGLVTAENTTSYGYDGATRLTSSTVGPSPIAYDVASQLTALGSTILDYNTGGELTSLTKSSGKTAFAYDKEGDRISMTPASGSVTAYGYDQAGRLVSYTHGSTTASYAYNGDGLRMSKTVDKKTSSFCWDLADGLPLILSSGSTYYVTGPGGLPLEQLSGTTVLYYSADQLGSTRLLTKASGAVAASFTYDPYGTLAKHTGTAKTAFGFAGQYTDWESGLVYLRARYYDPSTAQFLTVDPAVGSTRSPYTYVGGDPINVTDSSGLDSSYAPPDPLAAIQWELQGPVQAMAFSCSHFGGFVCVQLEEQLLILTAQIRELAALCGASKQLQSDIDTATSVYNQNAAAANAECNSIGVTCTVGNTTVSGAFSSPWCGAQVGGVVGGIAGGPVGWVFLGVSEAVAFHENTSIVGECAGS
jgi:RHS repeat-associated protein